MLMRFMGTGVGHGEYRQTFTDVLRIIARRAEAPEGNDEDSEILDTPASGPSKARGGDETGHVSDEEHDLDDDEDAPELWDTEDEGGDDEDGSESGSEDVNAEG